MNAKSLRWLGGLAVVIFVAAACGGTPASTSSSSPSVAASAAASASPAAKAFIPMISKGFQHQFWQAVKQGADKAAAQFNVTITFQGPENESQVDKQLEMLQTVLNQKPQALCFAALDSKAAIPLLQKFKDANIPVIGFDSGVDSDIPLATAATDNIAAAGAAADKMAALIGGSGDVAIVAHDQTSRTGIDRVKGFTDQIKNKYPNIKIVATQYGGGDQLKSTDITKAILQSNPNLKGIFGANEGSAVGVLNGVTESGKAGKVTVIGYDSGQQQMDAIRSGTESGAITQDPIGIGFKCVEAAVNALKGQTLPKNIDTGFKYYDKTNIDNPDIAALLYK
jgi:ribose transport system substrate-binding protein